MRRILPTSMIVPAKKLLAALLALLVCFSPALVSAQQIMAPSPGAELQLVDDPLYRGDVFYYRGDYYRAITQYELFLMRNADKDQGDAVRLKIAWLYAQAGKLAASADILKQIITTRPEADRMAAWARIYFGDVASKAGQGKVATRAFMDLFNKCDGFVVTGQKEKTPNAVGAGDCLYLKSYAKLGLARHYASVHEFEKSVEALRTLPEKSPLKVKADEIAAHVDGLVLPRKRPALAGALSIIPGLGHFYIEEYGAGIWAMIFNGAFIYGMADSIASKRYGQATLIGLVELIWYTGTIFGAVSGAHRFNRDARRVVEDGLESDLSKIDDDQPWPVRFPVDSNPVQRQWQWRF
ncbi:MAG: hypothetical protein VX475_06690 [Myxococcota bacterium]|nr:hypothetical protein [Myxococcota bacterium]